MKNFIILSICLFLSSCFGLSQSARLYSSLNDGPDDRFYDMVVYKDTVYALCSSFDVRNGHDYKFLRSFIIKIQPEGDKSIHELNINHNIKGLALDDSYIYIIAYSELRHTSLLVKCDHDFNILDSISIGQNQTFAQAVKIDNNGDILITGVTDRDLNGRSNSGKYDFFIQKYSPDLILKWSKLEGSNGNEYLTDSNNNIVIDQKNFIYILYTSDSASIWGRANNGGTDVYISKYSPGGERWLTSAIGGASNEYAGSLAIQNENLYVLSSTAGRIHGANKIGSSVTNDAILLSKLDLDLKILKNTVVNTSFQEYATSIAVASDGQIYITGATGGNLPGAKNMSFETDPSYGWWDIFIGLFNEHLEPKWFVQGGSLSTDFAYDIEIDSKGFIYVAGYAMGAVGSEQNKGAQDALLQKYTPDGELVWSTGYGSPPYYK